MITIAAGHIAHSGRNCRIIVKCYEKYVTCGILLYQEFLLNILFIRIHVHCVLVSVQVLIAMATI